MKNLTNEQKASIYGFLLNNSNDGKLLHGAKKEAASKFSTSRRTVTRIWEEVVKNGEDGLVDVSSKRIGRVGRKKLQFDVNQVLSIPLRRRTNIRSIASAMNVKKSTLHRRIKDGVLVPHTNAIKPHLTNENKRTRLKFCLSMLQEGTLNNNPHFIDMYNYIHIDEKWFYMTKTTERYYLHPLEEPPLRTCKSKKFITKVMFLAAVARPRFDEHGNEFFSGKLGIFPFVFKEHAKRKSKNRDAGTLETKSIPSVTKDVYRSYLVEKLLPIIRDRWPTSGPELIYLQQDNAKPHIQVDDGVFVEAASRCNLKVHLLCQPPNSPDMNVLDLGFFRAIEALQHQEAPNTIDELIASVEKSFNEFPSNRLNHVFVTLQMCMIEVMKKLGGNDYKLPHMNKNGRELNGSIPVNIEVDKGIVEEVTRYLQSST